MFCGSDKEMCTLYPNRRNKIGSTEFRRLLITVTKKGKVLSHNRPSRWPKGVRVG